METKRRTKDRVKLPFTFDTAKLIEEFEALKLNQFTYYDVIPLRAPAHLIDTSLPFPPPSDNYADGSWTEWLDTSYLLESSYLTSVVDTFRKHTKVTLVRMLRLEAGGIVKEHTDPTLGLEISESVIRLTIPVLTNDEVTFYLNDVPVDMKPGECWYLRLTDPHRITNFGKTERINVSIDIIPNDWVRGLIENS